MWRRLRKWSLRFLALLLILLVYIVWPGRSKFTVSKETTYFTGPLDADGFVDYPAALNAELGQGITPENNIVAELWKIVGPKLSGKEWPDDYFKTLGIVKPQENGSHFITYPDFQKQLPKYKFESEALKNHVMKRPSDEYMHLRNQPWKREDDPELADWIAANEKLVVPMRTAIAKELYFNPVLTAKYHPNEQFGYIDFFQNLDFSREITSFLCFHAMYALGMGQTDTAIEDLVSAMRLARMVSREPFDLTQLMSRALERTAIESLIACLHHAKPGIEKLDDIRIKMNKLPSLAPVARCFELGMKAHALSMILSGRRYHRFPAENNKWHPLDYTAQLNAPWSERFITCSCNFDVSLKEVNTSFDQLQQIYATEPFDLSIIAKTNTYYKANREKRLKLEEYIPAYLVYSSEEMGRCLGEHFYNSFVSPSTKFPESIILYQATLQLRDIAFALAAYRHQHQEYPRELSQLNPALIPSIQNDPFSDQPPVYKIVENGYILYYFGLNKKDDEGRTRNDIPEGDDIGLRVPNTKPVKPKPEQ